MSDDVTTDDGTTDDDTTAAGSATTAAMVLGRVGLWTFQLDLQPMSAAKEAVAELEQLGFGALWVPEAVGREPMANCALLLSATQRMVIATGIASLHARTAMTMQAGWKTLSEAFPNRFLLGIGVSHQPMVEAVHKHAYDKPYSTMVEYLDAMDKGPYFAAAPTAPPRRVLAALGPKMLRLSAERGVGAHPYFVPVEHTAIARETLGAGPLLAPEQAVVLETDPSAAREIARRFMSTYLRLPNYTNNLRRIGWTEEDITGPTDELVDAIVAWGSMDDVVARIRAHHDAGADHVCVQVLPSDQRALPMAEWRELAGAVTGI
jgi:probable F420-dependent oxidoreductase